MINKVTLIGNVGGDPDVRTLESGSSVGRFSLATNESYKDKEGNWQNQTEWHNVIVWRDMAEKANNQVKKGSTVYVEGKISYRKYTDKDGVEKTVTDIVCNYFRVLDKKEAAHGANMPTTEPPNAPQNPVARQEAAGPFGNETNGGDDLPF